MSWSSLARLSFLCAFKSIRGGEVRRHPAELLRPGIPRVARRSRQDVPRASEASAAGSGLTKAFQRTYADDSGKVHNLQAKLQPKQSIQVVDIAVASLSLKLHMESFMAGDRA